MTDDAGQIGILGAGRVAQALALGLAAADRREPLLWARDPERLAAALREIGTGRAAPSLRDLVDGCDTLIIAVSDDALSAMVAKLVPLLSERRTPFIVHVSGRSGAAILSPLAARGARTAAVHPAMTFTGNPPAEVAHMVGAYFTCTAPDAVSGECARALVTRLSGIAVEIDEEQRALYHAALCHASNHLVTLIAGATEALARTGIDTPEALVAPLVRAALENSLSQGFEALSGPVLRGDADTISEHLAALEEQFSTLLPVYRAMAGATLARLERDGPTAARAALRERLGHSPHD